LGGSATLAAPAGGTINPDDCWRRNSCNSRIVRSMPAFAASPYFSTASARVLASMSKLTGNAPMLVMICASPV
jgi:hypothetical protein